MEERPRFSQEQPDDDDSSTEAPSTPKRSIRMPISAEGFWAQLTSSEPKDQEKPKEKKEDDEEEDDDEEEELPAVAASSKAFCISVGSF